MPHCDTFQIRSILFRAAVCAVIPASLFLTAGCSTVLNPPAPQSADPAADVAASCDECHTFPGSILCRTDTVELADGAATQCFTCHSGAIRVDSTFDSDEHVTIFHDRMLQGRNGRSPATGPSHADGSLALDFTQCSSCHSSPPASFGHRVHEEQGIECYQCHFSSIHCDTVITDEELYFQQHYRMVTGGDSVPVPDSYLHMNATVEVSFAQNYELPFHHDTLFAFNRATGTCTNIQCHAGVEWGGAPIERTSWRSSEQ